MNVRELSTALTRMLAALGLVIGLSLAAGAVMTPLSGCEEGPAEETGEAIDDAADDMGDAIDDIGD